MHDVSAWYCDGGGLQLSWFSAHIRSTKKRLLLFDRKKNVYYIENPFGEEM